MFATSIGVQAAGFQILEQGASNLGTANAGATVNANNDASAAFWNPSAAFFTKKRGQIDMTANLIMPSFTLTGGQFSNTRTVTIPAFGAAGGPTTTVTRSSQYNGGDAGDPAVVPNMFATYKITDDLLFSLSITSPYSLGTKYTDGFAGSMQGLASELLTIDINPSLAYKITDKLSIGAGFSVQYLQAKLSSRILDTKIAMDGHSWGWGGNVGLTYEYMEGGRIGISYRSQISHNLKGDMRRNGVRTDDIDAWVTLPNTLNVGIYQRGWGEGWRQFAVMADYGWTSWSTFKQLNIKDAKTGHTINGTDEEPHGTEENWFNTSRIAAGIHWYPEFVSNDALVFRLGFAWDQAPVAKHNRTVRIPDSDRFWLSCGLGYTYKETVTFNLGYTFLIIPDSGIDRTETKTVTRTVDTPMGAQKAIISTQSRVKGTYAGYANLVSASIGVAF